MHLASTGKALFGSVGGAIVGDDQLKTRVGGDLTKIDCYVPGAENVK